MHHLIIRNLKTNEIAALVRDSQHPHPKWVLNQLAVQSGKELENVVEAYNPEFGEDAWGVSAADATQWLDAL